MTYKKQLETVTGLINKMFEIAGHNVKYEDIVERKDDWYAQWTMTKAQNEEWRKWGITFLRKTNRWPKYRAEKEMVWFDLMYGLKTSDFEAE